MTGPDRPDLWLRRSSAVLLCGGASILLYRTIALLAGGAKAVLKPWVVGLTYLEMALDALTIVGGIRWWVSGSKRHAQFPLRAGAAATVLHAIRVLVFVLGRTGPFVDFDVRPEQRADHDERWTWTEVVVAAMLSIMGLVGLLIIWRTGRRRHAPASARQIGP